MDQGSLERLANHRLKQEYIGGLGRKASEAFVRAEAAALGERYQRLLTAYAKIVEVAGYVMRPGITRTTNPIVIDRNYRSLEFGSGELSARVCVVGMDFTSVDTSFELTADSGKHGLGNEFLSTTGRTLRGGMPFRDDRSGGWIENIDFVGWGTAGDSAPALAAVEKELLPRVEAAEATQSLLWEAMQDPARNNGMALAAQAAYRDLSTAQAVARLS